VIFAWTCPFCGRDTTITENRYDEKTELLLTPHFRGCTYAKIEQVVCPNPDCKKFTFAVKVYSFNNATNRVEELITDARLIPPSFAKVLPDYIPLAIKQDYEEACAVRDLSPKAAATLARRALQGMIRDFWGVSQTRLIDEIEGIKNKVDPLTWKAIDVVRGVGNIGAHMEKDINVIVDVDPDEAGLLIELIETLVAEWYVQRYERQERMNAVIKLGDAKKAARIP
jgi:hypothetical protein